MTDDLTIRSFDWRDVPAITTIYRHYVEQSVATFDTEPPGETFMAEKFGHMRDLGHPILIAEQAGRLIGYAYASIYRPRPAYRFTCEDSIYLHKDAAGKGLGSRLLAQLLVDAKAFGFRQMLAVITAERANSVRLHEKHGFKFIGQYAELGFKFDRWLDIVHMQKTL